MNPTFGTSKALLVSLFRVSGATQTVTRRWGHSVRLIALQDLPHGRGYQGDVVTVKAGYARNFLVPQKKAVYATPKNFEKLGIVDPDVETEEQRITRLQKELSMDTKAEKYLKEADILRRYLRTKMVSSGSSSRVLSVPKILIPDLNVVLFYFVLSFFLRSSRFGGLSTQTRQTPSIRVW